MGRDVYQSSKSRAEAYPQWSSVYPVRGERIHTIGTFGKNNCLI
jgi:hypothetical protein